MAQRVGLLERKRCLVLGVSNRWSIGWGIAQAFHREGGQLAFSYSRERSGQHQEDLLTQLPGAEDALRVRCDVSDDAQIAALFERVAAHWDGKLDVLVHTPANARPEDLSGRYVDVSREGYLYAHGISAYSLVACARYAAPLFEAAGGGNVIALSYLAGERVVPGYNVMASAKAALETHVRYLAADLGPQNVRVNAISAGPIKTLRSSGVKGTRAFRDVMAERSPLRRNVTQLEVGNVAAFLASDLAKCVTGEVIFADNGFNILGVGVQ